MLRADFQKGFTLIELMAVVAIAGILAAIGMPSYRAMISNVQARSATSDLYSGLLRARSEAIRFNRAVTLQPATGGWQAGWVIPGAALTDNPIAEQSISRGITVTGRSGGAAPTSIVFQPSGRISPQATAPYLQVQSTASSGAIYCLSVDLTGKAYTAKGTGC